MATYKQVGYGSQGNEVTELQKMLNQNGYQLDEDGIFGSKTQAAVKDYQQKNNLDVDGIVGNNTWGALTKANTPSAAAASTPSTNTGIYQESDTVKQAQALLRQQLSQKPGQYQSAWQSQLDDTIQKILNREKFSYDLNGDALYQQYKDQYVTQGQQAMMDTMGQAQAMTGGYGNSYAQTVGQQTYQGYLQQLNDKVPELYQLAMSKYQMEGDAQKDQYALLGAQEDQDYGRYRDQMGDYNIELDRLQNRYDTERDYDYSKWADDRNYDYQTGRDQIADKQWQAEFDEAIRQYDINHGIIRPVAGGAGGGAGGSSGGNTGNTGNTGTTHNYNSHGYNVEQIKALQKAAGIPADGIWGPQTEKAYNAGYRPDSNPNTQPTGGDGGGDGFTGSTYSEAVAYMKQNGVSSAEASGVMTQSEWQRRKNAGSGSAEVKNYSSYKEYLADYVEYKTSK